MKKRIVVTGDGSPSVVIEEWDEQYHSRHGARQESEHVFIQSGLSQIQPQKVSEPIEVLEVGFGTGLNALLTAQYCAKNHLKVNYTTLEAFPLETDIINELAYGKDDTEVGVFDKIHNASWGQENSISAYFSFTKVKLKIEDWQTKNLYHLCYYDAFAPRVQPELWKIEIFEDIALKMRKGGILVTYCAKGQVRRDMESAGFKVERLPGPPGKREMLRAIKI